MNRKKLTALTLAAALALSLSACGEPSAPAASPDVSVPAQTPEPEITAQPAAEEISLFSQLKDLEFYFASGAGGWRTILHIDGYGSFSGTYSDSDMGGKRRRWDLGYPVSLRLHRAVHPAGAGE